MFESKEIIRLCIQLVQSKDAKVYSVKIDDMDGYRVCAMGRSFDIWSGYMRNYISGPRSHCYFLDINGVKYASNYQAGTMYIYYDDMTKLMKAVESVRSDQMYSEMAHALADSIRYLRGNKRSK